MKRRGCAVVIPLLSLFSVACATAEPPVVGPQELRIVEQWDGDYPVAALDLLPAGQRHAPVGWLDADSFPAVWQTLQSGVAPPPVDFDTNLVVFVRNTEFYNRTRIARISRVDGVAEVLAMQTMSALPIEDRVAMALAVIPRAGITALRLGERKVSITPVR